MHMHTRTPVRYIECHMICIRACMYRSANPHTFTQHTMYVRTYVRTWDVCTYVRMYVCTQTGAWIYKRSLDMSHVWISHVTHMIQICYLFDMTSCHVVRWMTHVTRTNEYVTRTNEYVTRTNESCHTSCHTCEWVISHTAARRKNPATDKFIHVSHDTRINESCHTYERVESHIWMSHVTFMNDSCHTS